jgi:hypothetical protein
LQHVPWKHLRKHFVDSEYPIDHSPRDEWDVFGGPGRSPKSGDAEGLLPTVRLEAEGRRADDGSDIITLRDGPTESYIFRPQYVDATFRTDSRLTVFRKEGHPDKNYTTLFGELEVSKFVDQIGYPYSVDLLTEKQFNRKEPVEANDQAPTEIFEDEIAGEGLGKSCQSHDIPSIEVIPPEDQ